MTWVPCPKCSHLDNPICCPTCEDKRGWDDAPVKMRVVDLFDALAQALTETHAQKVNPCTTSTPTCDPLQSGARCVDGGES